MREKSMEMGLSKLLAFFLFSLIFQTPASAVKQSYIVYMGVHSHGLKDAMASVSKVKESHNEFLASFLGSTEKAKESIFYSYTRDINGFAAILDEEEAAAIARHPNVLSVFLNKGKHLHTTHSWEFMLLEQNGVAQHNSLWSKASYGEDIIIGNLDTGVWPESESFSDKGFGAVPAKWKGFCENNTSTGVPCNRKLIGARHFKKAYFSGGGELSASTNSPRDNNGHGSHTLSTAGGNFVPGAKVLGLFNGTAKGGSPKARVAAYKVCWPPNPLGGECYDGDILAAFDAAIHDRVDVLSVSLGGPSTDYFGDATAIGSFHAVMNGVVVICSAGNGGPGDYTVTNVAPWIITVGASTTDRKFVTLVKLPNGKRFEGTSISKPLPGGHKFYPLISSAHAKAKNASAEEAMLCKEGTLDPKKVKGKILVCLRGDNPRVEKGMLAALAGAVGMILCNDEPDGNEIITDPHYLPASHINYTDGLVVYAYINSTKDPKAYITASTAKMRTEPAPFMASFSSKGPNFVTPEILKPDITAPGVNIIAAYTEAHSPTENDFDKRRTGFTTESGTSMSCPHVSGVVGLLKKLHPDWSPGAIKSAIMTTARTRDNTVNPMRNGTSMKATPFSYGAGHVRPNRAAHPGLVYDLNANDYLDFLCGIGYNQTTIKLFSKAPYSCPSNFSLLDFNYPSITVPNLFGSVTVSRTVKNVGSPGVYAASIREPHGVLVSVEPDVLKFDRTGEEKSFKLTLTNKKLGGAGEYVFGQLLWSDGRHYVRSPIVVASKAAFVKKSAQLGVAGGIRSGI
ncbi:subtilisin-like protease SBT5.4 isoform X2 [Rhododendron vialii]|uniref:subtilisin-like protease SBT5.4 isoform X2 n=1 Tax=Rhododendron vialii TaxID=182163 RepID=UPI00265F86BA|nr:subtilisin-like protease SBT5.4 isoform X2 [Rhododendron vialii]